MIVVAVGCSRCQAQQAGHDSQSIRGGERCQALAVMHLIAAVVGMPACDGRCSRQQTGRRTAVFLLE